MKALLKSCGEICEIVFLEQLQRPELLVGKPERKGRLGRPRRRLLDNITMDLMGKGLDGVDWNGLAQNRNIWRTLVNSVMYLRVHKMLGNY
jgi:hypothetical protein